MDCSPTGSSVHGILQECVAVPFTRGSSQHTWVSCIAGGFFTTWAIREALIYFNWRLITLQYCDGFCHTSTWISRRCTCPPILNRRSHLPPHTIPLGCPRAPALIALLSLASNLHWSSILHMVIYMFQCYSLKSSQAHLLPQSPKVCSLHQCLFSCLAYRVVITIFLNSIYMC